MAAGDGPVVVKWTVDELLDGFRRGREEADREFDEALRAISSRGLTDEAKAREGVNGAEGESR